MIMVTLSVSSRMNMLNGTVGKRELNRDGRKPEMVGNYNIPKAFY